MWRVCPICKGEGKSNKFKTVGTKLIPLSNQCNCCKGYGIINELDGQPPSYKHVDLKEDTLETEETILKKMIDNNSEKLPN